MRFFLYYFVFRLIFGNPLLALIIIAVIYLLVDRKFIGLMPDVLKPFKRKSRIKALHNTINLNPANVNAHRELGLLYLEDKKYPKAIEHLLKTLDKMEQYAEVHFNLGKAYYLSGEREKGKNELEKAVEISSKAGYGEPYVYLLDAEINRDNEIINKQRIDTLIDQLKTFGTTEILYKAGKVIKHYDQEKAKKLFEEALETYRASPKHFKKTHRGWAFRAKLNMIF